MNDEVTYKYTDPDGDLWIIRSTRMNEFVWQYSLYSAGNHFMSGAVQSKDVPPIEFIMDDVRYQVSRLRVDFIVYGKKL